MDETEKERSNYWYTDDGADVDNGVSVATQDLQEKWDALLVDYEYMGSNNPYRTFSDFYINPRWGESPPNKSDLDLPALLAYFNDWMHPDTSQGQWLFDDSATIR